MDIALVTEGTYPYHFGGVSVWCDQLVRAMAEDTFHVVALVGTGTEQAVWPRPANVAAIHPVPMWGPPTGIRTGRRARPKILAVLGELIDILLEPTVAPQRFGDLLRGLAEYGRRE